MDVHIDVSTHCHLRCLRAPHHISICLFTRDPSSIASVSHLQVLCGCLGYLVYPKGEKTFLCMQTTWALASREDYSHLT